MASLPSYEEAAYGVFSDPHKLSMATRHGFIQAWPLLSTSAAGDSFSSRISYSHAQATHATDSQLIPEALDQTPTHSHSSNSKVSDEYRNIFCELRRPASCRPR